jgi:aldose 1-epimerase
VAGSEFDFRHAREVGPAVLDVCYRVAGRREARFAGRTLWWDAAFGYLQVFTGDTLPEAERRRGLALEPLTCPADAFNSGEGLLVLEPGEKWSGSWGIRP